MRCSLLYAPLALIISANAVFAAPDAAQAKIEFFEKKVRPLFVSRCYACHSAETKPAGGLRVDDRNGLLTGGDSGPAIIPGEASQSLILQRIQHKDPKKRMPKEGQLLSEAEVADLSQWIADGAAWPAEKMTVISKQFEPFYERLRAKHWAFQAVKKPAVPQVTAKAWPLTDIDRFILAKLEEKQLNPVKQADKLTLIRRVTYDLTGLPPTPAEIDAFLRDTSKLAYENLVDRLLASPRFGERWGRHWLDIARYGESTGPSRNVPYPHAWRYRDYVIEAVNKDIPYNRFLEEQIAGDLLPSASAAERDRLLIATGFLALGPKDVNQRFKERYIMDNVAEQIDTVTRGTMAMTVSCARCHDHKFDPIPTTDYYALAGIFTSTEDCVGLRNKMGGAGLDYYNPQLLLSLATPIPAPPADEVAKLSAELAIAKKEWEDIRGTPEGLTIAANGRPKQYPYRIKYEKLQQQMLFLTDPGSRGYGIHGARDSKKPSDTAVRIRGEAERLGPVAPRGFLTAFKVPGAAPLNPEQSGRLQLAQWIANPENPLTSRVYVNRVWAHLFGQGIVSTTDNFGLNGDKPSNQELLDYLAADFVEGGWSTKRLIRTLTLSRAYRLSAEAPARNREVDPANKLVWRHAPRRLDAEEIRDSMLFAAGRLELQTPATGAAADLRMIEMPDNGPVSRTVNERADKSMLRSVYLPLLRGVTPKSLEAFDPVTQSLVTGQRDATTVPTQALYMLNSSFVRRQSLSLAQSLLSAEKPKPAAIRQAYRLVLGREPEKTELARAEAFLAGYQDDYASLPPVEVKQLPIASKQASASDAKSLQDPIDPDNIDRTSYVPPEEPVIPESPRQAAWMSFAQALFATAEFRFVR